MRRAFRARGHDAVSCDLLPASDGETRYHVQGDVTPLLREDWDLILAFPPCTHLAVSGAVHFPAKRADGRQAAALEFVRLFFATRAPRLALENPVGIISTVIRKPDQIIHPWQFGHVAMKTTCLWLRGLPPLTPTAVVDRGPIHVHASGKRSSQWSMDTFRLPAKDRARVRSQTFPGIAAAMAAQWG